MKLQCQVCKEIFEGDEVTAVDKLTEHAVKYGHCITGGCRIDEEKPKPSLFHRIFHRKERPD